MTTKPMDLNEAKWIVAAAGFATSDGCWEDEKAVYACSRKSAGKGTFGHPAFEVHFDKETGWVSITGQSPQKIA